MQSISQKIIVLAVLLYTGVWVPFAHAAATTSATLSSPALSTSRATSTPPVPSVGASELKKEILAEKARLAQLKQKLQPATQNPQPTPGIVRSLAKGSIGKDVQLLQKFLKLYGTFSAPIATGYFGTLTRQAVKDFQRKESIDVVGIAGPKTRARILALSKYEVAQEKKRIASSTIETMPDITDVIFSTDVGEDGSGVASSTVFASTTKNIYAILTLAHAKQDTEVGLIRRYKDTYVDSEVTHPSRSGLRYLHFQWSLKVGANRTPGPYTVTFYINGKKTKTAAFTIN